MRLTRPHPAHTFEEVKGLPAYPGLTGRNYRTVRCTRCGMTALRRDGDGLLTFTGIAKTTEDVNRVRFCNTMMDDRYGILHARITTDLLPLRNPAWSHLVGGTLHRVVPPPTDDNASLPGVWVAGPDGPVKVLEGEYLPVKVRDRHRQSRQLQLL